MRKTGLVANYEYIESNGNRLVTITLPDGQVEQFKAKVEPECTTFIPTIDVHLV